MFKEIFKTLETEPVKLQTKKLNDDTNKYYTQEIKKESDNQYYFWGYYKGIVTKATARKYIKELI